jgi:hypothetical protein
VSRVKNSFISSFERGTRYRLKAIHVAAFIALFLLVFGSLEYLNRTYSVVGNRDYGYLSGFLKEEKDVKILFLGDSQFEWGVNADRFPDKAYNLSFGGINFIQSYYLLRHEIDKMPRLEIVVLPLDHHSLHPFKTDRFELFFVDKYIVWLDLAPIKGPMIILNGLRCFTILDDTLGRKSLVEKAIRRLFGRKLITFKRPAQDLLLYYYKTLLLCAEHHVTVVTLSTPVTREYLANAEKKLYHIDDIKRTIFNDPKYRDLIYRHLDYIGWNPDDKGLYKDGHHLNKKGRDAFTPVLVPEIETILKEISDGRG